MSNLPPLPEPDHDGSALTGGLGPLPEPWRAGDLKPDTQVYTADACWFYAARAVAAERERCARLCESMGAMEALEGEEIGGAAMVRVADRMADLCAAAIRAA